jgi:hypothetical protein
MNGSHPFTGLERFLGLQEVKAPRFSGQSTLESGTIVNPTHQQAAFTPGSTGRYVKKLEILFKPMPSRSPGFARLSLWQQHV